MLNQQHNQANPQLLNVQRPHQIQPPGQHRMVQPGQPMQQHQMQQVPQQINIGQPQMTNMQGQRLQKGPLAPQQMQQPLQNHMMNMGQQTRPAQNQQAQMMQNPQQSQQQQQQQQMRGNSQQQMHGMPSQGSQMQQQQPPMPQMRMQQNPQNMNGSQPQQRMPAQNMQLNQQAMRMTQAQNQQQQQQRMPPHSQPMQIQQQGLQNMNIPLSQQLQIQQNGPQNMNLSPSHQHQMQLGGAQVINRPPSQINMQQQGGVQNMNRPPSQPHHMQPNMHQNMNRQLPQMQQVPPRSTPPLQQIRIQPAQPAQQNPQNMSNEQSQQHQQMQPGSSNMNMQSQQPMRMSAQEPQMQSVPVPMNGPQPVRVAQLPQKQQTMQPPPRQLTPQQSQGVRGSMQNSPQNTQMRVTPGPPQQQTPNQQPMHPSGSSLQGRQIPSAQQGRQILPNQQRQQQMPMNRNAQHAQLPPNVSDQSMSMPMQQTNMQPPVSQQSMQPPVSQQPMQQPPKQQIQPPQTDNFEPDNGSTIRINGEHAIINGMQYKLVQMSGNSASQQGHQGQPNISNPQVPTVLQPQQAPLQGPQQALQQSQRPQQRALNNQRPNQQQLPNQQSIPNQQSVPSHQNMTNLQNQQNPVPPLQQQQQVPVPMSAKTTPRSRYRGKKSNGPDSVSQPVPQNIQNIPSTSEAPGSQKMGPPIPNISTPSKGGRRIMPPPMVPGTSHSSQGQNQTSPNIQMRMQGKNLVQVGGFPPNRQLVTPGKNLPRNMENMKALHQRPNGKMLLKNSGGTSGPTTSKQDMPENKENMAVIKDAIVLHIKGTRKMTPEYIDYVSGELTRLMREMEKAGMSSDSRYISVRKMLALMKREKLKIIIPPRIPMPKPFLPTEDNIENSPVDESAEQRKERIDSYRELLANAYQSESYNVNFCGLTEEIIRTEIIQYREQDMKNREAYLKKNLHMFPEEEQTKAKIEYLGLSLLDFQTELRKQVMATTILVPPTEFLINPWSIRRTKFEYLQELKRHPDRAVLEKKRKVANYHFLQSLTKHAREFKEFHKRNMANHTKVRKSMQQYITNENKRIAREEMKNEKLRIQKLIQEDEEGYRAMLDDKKDKRLVYLLEQTDDYIKSLCDLLQQQKDSSSGTVLTKKVARKEYEGLAEEEKVKSILDKARNEDDEYENKTKMNIEDYYTTAHGIREEITEQHYMMGGGNPNLKLKPYQIKGLEWMVSLYNNNLNGILADEMGLGKTIQTIAFITYLMEIKKTSGPFLVIVPLSTISNWQNEFSKWSSNVHLIVYKGSKDVRKANEPIIKSGKFNVLLTTFEYVIREKALLGKLRWKYMIIDEGHRLKNQHCKLTEMLNTRFQCQRRLLITGTPLQNKLPELWALLNFLLPSIFSSCSTFEQWFNAPFATTGEKVELTQEETMLIIRRLHKVLRPFLLRRLKKEVESELPDKMEFVIKCEMSALQKMLYKHMQKGLLLDGKTNTGSRSLMNSMVHLRKLCNHPFLFENVEESCRCFWETKYISAVDLYRVSGKLELLDRILPKLQATGHRVLMFFQMTSMMTVVEDYLAGGTIQYLRLDGSTKPDERGALLDKFNAPNSEYFLFMLSTRAGGLGLNLQTADTVIIFDSDWNPHQDMQAQDRAHRIGQKSEVRVFRLITANSVEEKILASARFKLNVDEKVIQAGKFDNRSTGAERRQILENIIKAENESEEDEDVPNDEEINDILSRTEEEFELFQKMDQERFEHDMKNNIKPRLCGDDEIPEDILRAADETDYIEKAKEEGRVPYFEVMPGSKRTRKEIDYSADTMSDDKFLEKLFEGEDVASVKPETKSNVLPENTKIQSEPGSSTESAKEQEMPAVMESPASSNSSSIVFKVPRLTLKLGESLKRKHKKSESDTDDISSKKSKRDKSEDFEKGKDREKVKANDKEKEKGMDTEKEKDFKRKHQSSIEKIRIKFTGEPVEKFKKSNDEFHKKNKDHKEEKSSKHHRDDESSPKKKKNHDRDDEESREKEKKKHKHDTDSPLKHQEWSPSTSAELKKDHPPLKLKLNVRFTMPNPTPSTSKDDEHSKEIEKRKEKEKERKKKDKDKEKNKDKEKDKEKKKDKEKDKKSKHGDKEKFKDKAVDSEHKKKSREGESEEERRARKEAKRLKRLQEEKEDEARYLEKLAKKAARKEQKRLEMEKLNTSTDSVTTTSAAGSV